MSELYERRVLDLMARVEKLENAGAWLQEMRRLHIYDAAARIAAALVTPEHPDTGRQPYYSGSEDEERQVSELSVSLALQLDTEVRRRLGEEE